MQAIDAIQHLPAFELWSLWSYIGFCLFVLLFGTLLALVLMVRGWIKDWRGS